MNDQNKDKEPGAGFAFIVIPAMFACCLVPILLIGGAFSGFTAWLSDGGAVTIGLATVAGGLGVYLYKTKVARRRKDHAVEPTPPDHWSPISRQFDRNDSDASS